MSTASITHHPISMTTAAAAAPAVRATNVDNARKQAGRVQVPPGGGRTMIGLR